jgi:hypothetical protein
MSRAINTQRAGWAAAALTVFQRTVGESDIETAMVDLIADLGHLAKKHKLGYIAILKRGIRAWAYEERDPCELGASPSVSIRITPIGKRRRSKSGASQGDAA